MGGGGFNPGITHNFPDTDGRCTYNICLASASQICTFSKSHNYYKKKKMSVILDLYYILNNSEFASGAYGNKEK